MLLSVFAVLLSISLSAAGPPPQPTRVVIVVRADEKPVAGAEVVVGTAPATTNESGEARDVSATTTELFNAADATNTWGTELIARLRAGEFGAMVTHAWTRSSEPDPDTAIRRRVPLTAPHAASIDLMWEAEGRGRLGLEIYYVGRQPLDDNPYRTSSESYWLTGFFGERRLGPLRLFVNMENVFDVRQTRHDPLVLPARLPDGRWTVDAWAPLDGRVANAGVRISFR